MEYLILHMENLSYHLAHIERLHPSSVTVQNIGFQNKQSDYFLKNRSFSTINFSFVLEGEGTFRIDDKSPITIKAPYLITQCDSNKYSYGPNKEGFWGELFFMYDLSARDYFTELDLYSKQQRCWPIHNRIAVEEYFQKLIDLLRKRDQVGIIDQIDRICELMILTSKQQLAESLDLPYYDQIRKIKQLVDQHPELPINFQDLSKSVGMSYSTFRKNWKKHLGISPQKYLNDRRMREARRLLIETRLSIGEIAHYLQFEDRLYFSKKFRENTKLTASQYRENNKLHTLT